MDLLQSELPGIQTKLSYDVSWEYIITQQIPECYRVLSKEDESQCVHTHARENLPLKGTHTKGGLRAHLIPEGILGWSPDPRGESS